MFVLSNFAGTPPNKELGIVKIFVTNEDCATTEKSKTPLFF